MTENLGPVATFADRLAYVLTETGIDTRSLRAGKLDEVRAAVLERVREHLVTVGMGDQDGRMAEVYTKATMARLKVYLTGGSPWDLLPLGQAGVKLAQMEADEAEAKIEEAGRAMLDRGFSDWVVKTWLGELKAYSRRMRAARLKQQEREQRKVLFVRVPQGRGRRGRPRAARA
ncbi:MAG TPA: hypothetical protein VGN75_15125 [Kaistia sp.]|nr:hypothetical protein [Kaistia sp.]